MEIQCSKCKKQKPLSEFYKRPTRKSGVVSHCKECKRNHAQKYYQIHKTKYIQYARNRRKTLTGYLCHCFYHIKDRCTNPKNKDYKYYGGRGIKCSFKSVNDFVNYILNILKTDLCGLEIDRIDNNGNYEPGNIRFVTHKENCNNRKR